MPAQRVWRREPDPPRRRIRLRRLLLTGLAGLRSIQLTLACVLTLLATTVIQRLVGAVSAARLLAASSTDVAHLAHHPVRVLVASALWLPGRGWVEPLLLLALVLALLERRAGTRLAAAVFAAGHVVATLATELGVAVLVSAGALPRHGLHRVDVGVSYGFYACVGAMAGLLPVWLRWVALPAAAAWLTAGLLRHLDLTSTGHLLSLAVGVASWRWLPSYRLAGSPE